VSDEADRLAQAALNRGLKLIRSRVRTPGKPGFGHFALKNAAGEIVLGGGPQPSANPEEVEAYLRNQERGEWSGSVGKGGVRRSKRKPATVKSSPPPLRVRGAVAADAEAIAALIALLGHPVSANGVRKRLKLVAAPTLVATLGETVIGLCGLDTTTHIHRDRPAGRITILAVAQDHRRAGVGRLLMEEAERRLRKAGCELIEITSNRRHAAAHDFYRHLGYDQPSLRFAKRLRD